MPPSPRRPRPSLSILMSLPLLISLLIIIAIFFVFFALTPFNKTWDSFNILLVLFAVFCGVIARQNDDASCTSREEQHAFPVTAYVDLRITEDGSYVSDQGEIYHTPIVRLHSPFTGDSRLRRSSMSFSDQSRRQSPWETGTDGYRFLYSDDFEMDLLCSPAMDPVPENDHTRRVEIDFNEIPMDTIGTPSMTPPKSEKKKSSVKKEMEMVWASILSNQNKKKKKRLKQRTKTIHEHDSDNALHASSELPNEKRSPPPISRFLFKKGLCKGNKVHSVSVPSPLRRKTLPEVNTGHRPALPPRLELAEDADVDVKAATFIAKLREKWKLEKLNSTREKASFRLGPGPGPLI